MRRGSFAALAATAVMGMTAVPASAEPIEIGHIPECLELVPAAVTVLPDGDVGLQLRVLLDGVSSARGQEIIGLISQSYAPLGITVVPSFQNVSFSGDDAQGLIDQSKALFGGERPAGIDVVYTLTSKDITAGGNNAVAGLADCIGGVAFPDHAFAVGEVLDPDSFDLGGGLVVSDNLSAKVAAHEVGHLFGGHHHYANCVEGLLSELGAELSPCTLMFNAVDLTSFNFSAVNGLVVRGHGEAYAAG